MAQFFARREALGRFPAPAGHYFDGNFKLFLRDNQIIQQLDQITENLPGLDLFIGLEWPTTDRDGGRGIIA